MIPPLRNNHAFTFSTKRNNFPTLVAYLACTKRCILVSISSIVSLITLKNLLALLQYNLPFSFYFFFFFKQKIAFSVTLFHYLRRKWFLYKFNSHLSGPTGVQHTCQFHKNRRLNPFYSVE